MIQMFTNPAARGAQVLAQYAGKPDSYHLARSTSQLHVVCTPCKAVGIWVGAVGHVCWHTAQRLSTVLLMAVANPKH
jgi:hypothetical protein